MREKALWRLSYETAARAQEALSRRAGAVDGQEPPHELRSLQRYARPGPDAVAQLTADHDPERRRH